MNSGEKWLAFWGFILLLIMVGVLSFFMLNSKLFIKYSNHSGLLIGKRDEELYKKIKSAYEMKDYQKTLDLSSDFLTDYPESDFQYKVLSITAGVFYDQRDYNKARQILQKIFAGSPRDSADFVDAVVLLGAISKEYEKYDPVVLNYLEDAYLKADNSKKPFLAVYLAYQYFYKKDYINAVTYFNNGPDEEDMIGRARVYIEQGYYPQAIQEYLNYFNAYPKTERYERMKSAFIKQSFFYAEVLKKSKEYQKAIQYFLNIINIFPQDPAADQGLIKIADIYAINKDYKNAALFLDKALQNSMTNSDEEALYNKAVLFYEWKKKQEAIKLFKDLQEKHPDGIYTGKAKEWIDIINKDLQ